MNRTTHQITPGFRLCPRFGHMMLALFLATGLSGVATAQSSNEEAAAQAPLTVDINSDPALVLSDLLSGIGPAKAAAIVAYREENGPFESVDDLTQVGGIGSATLEQIRPQVLLEGSSE